jgi:hypothetical protein
MNQSFLAVSTLLNWRLRTNDGLLAGLRDLLIDADDWSVQLMSAEAEGWAPERELLVAPRAVTGRDEVSAALELDIDAESLRASPSLSTDAGLAGVGDEAALPPGWDNHWRAEMDPEDGVDPPPAPTEDLDAEVAADLGAETGLSIDDLVRAETLCGWTAETADGVSFVIDDIVVDDRDWTLAYVDVALGETDEEAAAPAAADARAAGETSCLIPRQSLDWLNRSAETLHLAAWAQELRAAPVVASPVAFDERATVRVYEAVG